MQLGKATPEIKMIKTLIFLTSISNVTSFSFLDFHSFPGINLDHIKQPPPFPIFACPFTSLSEKAVLLIVHSCAVDQELIFSEND
jgi:hypothetical protein